MYPAEQTPNIAHWVTPKIYYNSVSVIQKSYEYSRLGIVQVSN